MDSLVGALVGDAAGATLEFYSGEITGEMAMTAIVGGVLGAYKPVPDYMVRPVMMFDCVSEQPGHQIRPPKYSVKRVIGHLL